MITKIFDTGYQPKPGDVLMASFGFGPKYSARYTLRGIFPFTEQDRSFRPGSCWYVFECDGTAPYCYLTDEWVQSALRCLNDYWEVSESPNPDLSHLPDGEIDPVGRWA